MSEGLTQIIVAIVSTGVVVELAHYFLGGKRQGNLDVMQTELQRLDARVERMERQLERYEMRDTIYSSATSCAHKCKLADEECPVLNFLGRNPLPEKTLI